ncbi:MAG: biopolymer transporter ExbD [Phycisphaerales bacterium]|nr:biopolymer transporter ExbD [Phycisphaerales bacterium]
MIDVVLQLIIFFLYTSTFTQMARTPLELPEQDGDEAAYEPAKIVIDVASDGSLFIEREPVTADEAIRLVELEIDRLGDATHVGVTIRADRFAAAQHVNELVVGLTTSGVRAISFGTLQPGGG